MNSTTYAVDEYGNEAADVRSGYIGEIKMFGFSGVPAHCLACDGSLLSIAAYPELYTKLGTLYGGDGVTTFALPTAEDVIYAAGNGRAVGMAVADGLPNIHSVFGPTNLLTTQTFPPNGGEIQEDGDYVVHTSGFSWRTNSMGYLGAGDISNPRVQIFWLTFDAAEANSIYGASTHVQPKGTAFNFCIVYE